MGRRKKSGAQPRTVGVIVQDKSGSMFSRREATISGFNEYLDTLKREQGDSEALLTLTQFDTKVTDRFVSKPLSEVPTLTPEDYSPGGGTALYDALGRAIRATERSARKDDIVLVVIMTDGQENSSNEWNHEGIIKLMDEKREAGWEFIFLGAGQAAWATGQSLGFTTVNSVNYGDFDSHDHNVAFGEAAMATSSVLRGATAQSYLSTSPIKVKLESKAGYDPGVNIRIPPRRRRKVDA